MILSKASSSRRLVTSRLLGLRAARPLANSVRLTSTATTIIDGKEDSNADSLKFVSHFKSPIVQQLWVARQEAKANAAEKGQSLPEFRVPSQSMTSISYPFSTNEFLKESYRNPWGQVRFGKILEDLE
jgi:acyl-coenzyme A thioesterase 9